MIRDSWTFLLREKCLTVILEKENNFKIDRKNIYQLSFYYSQVFSQQSFLGVVVTVMEPYLYIFWQHFFIDTYLIEHNRHFLSTYFFVNHFELSYWSYDIWPELVDKPFIISYFPRTFCPTLGHHQGRMYYKSDVTFVCALQLCKNERLYCCIV